ncbi:hypothetical protein BH23BAC1_BH23BAC1_12350 [soil metagenome]
MSKRITTYNHDEIKNWAEEKKGTPALVYKTKPEGTISTLAIDFEENPLTDDTMEKISWEKFFELFEKKLLALQYEEGEKGENDFEYKLVGRTL